MTPNVDELFQKFSFEDIWTLLLKLYFNIPKNEYKKLCCIIYRIAYMLDFKILNETQVRFRPDNDILKVIHQIQTKINSSNIDIDIYAFLHFIDILCWNEDVKYQSYCEFIKIRTGRINTALSIISIPLIFANFIEKLTEDIKNGNEPDYSSLIKVAQNFARTRGIQPISNVQLVEFLSPYLTN